MSAENRNKPKADAATDVAAEGALTAFLTCSPKTSLTDSGPATPDLAPKAWRIPSVSQKHKRSATPCARQSRLTVLSMALT